MYGQRNIQLLIDKWFYETYIHFVKKKKKL